MHVRVAVKIEIYARFKHLAADLFKDFENITLFTVNFSLLHDIAEDFSQFCRLNFLHTSPLEYFNYVVKMFIRVTVTNRDSTFEEAVWRVKMSARSEKS